MFKIQLLINVGTHIALIICLCFLRDTGLIMKSPLESSIGDLERSWLYAFYLLFSLWGFMWAKEIDVIAKHNYKSDIARMMAFGFVSVITINIMRHPDDPFNILFLIKSSLMFFILQRRVEKHVDAIAYKEA